MESNLLYIGAVYTYAYWIQQKNEAGEMESLSSWNWSSTSYTTTLATWSATVHANNETTYINVKPIWNYRVPVWSNQVLVKPGLGLLPSPPSWAIWQDYA